LKPREYDEEGFGHYEIARCPNGDTRGSFVTTKRHTGRRPHHLYLWHITDAMGVLKDVLNVLSPSVSGDCDGVPGDTAVSQKRTLKPQVLTALEEDRDNKKQKFRGDVTSALKDIGKGMLDFNKMKDYSIGLHRLTCINDSIAQVRACIRAEEVSVNGFQFKLLESKSKNETDLLDNLNNHHGNRIEEYTEELLALMHKRNRVTVAEDKREEKNKTRG
jgi:hypothetical protein